MATGDWFGLSLLRRAPPALPAPLAVASCGEVVLVGVEEADEAVVAMEEGVAGATELSAAAGEVAALVEMAGGGATPFGFTTT